jgi:sec-independent protein translocase protein TatB
MFEVGFSEMVVIFALALVVLGPQRLPGLVAQVGRWAGRARAMARQFREQLETEAEALSATETRLRTTSVFEPEKLAEPSPPAQMESSVESKESTASDEPSHERGA